MLINDSPQERVSERWRQVNRICQHLASYLACLERRRVCRKAGVAVGSMNTVTREHALLNVSFKIRVHYTDAFHLHGRHKWLYFFASIGRRPVMMSITACKVHACVYHVSFRSRLGWLVASPRRAERMLPCVGVFTEVSLTWGTSAHLCVRRSGCYYSFHQNRRHISTGLYLGVLLNSFSSGKLQHIPVRDGLFSVGKDKPSGWVCEKMVFIQLSSPLIWHRTKPYWHFLESMCRPQLWLY